MMRSSLALAFLAFSTSAQTPPSFLLPNNVRPTKHTIELTVDPAQSFFEGRSLIDVDLADRSSAVWVNGKGLLIRSASVESGGKSQTAATKAVAGEFIAITFRDNIGPGPARLDIRFRAPLSDLAKSGPYRRSVNNRWYAFSVFTPIDARRAFPCFDEPRFKTPWRISIRVKAAEQAFSNAPEVSTETEPGGNKLIHFADTPPLPAEVVAFAVGPFDVFAGEASGAKHTPVRVVTPAGEAPWGKDAATATQAVLPRLEAYTGIPYPWAKLDHVALPEGAFGAVENPGMITYLARALLVSPAVPDRSAQDRSIRALEAHELGHQWFGNLVTQLTWKDVWLSEGFATWIAAKMMDQEQPPENRNLHAIDSRERMMREDLGSGFAVRSLIESRKDADNVYNGTVYQKGAAILLMIENWLGAEAFQRGLQTYLHEHEFANVTSEDLANALTVSSSQVDVAPVLFSFLDTKGVPHVRSTVDCTPEGARMTLTQTSSGSHWLVPVCWRAAGFPAACTVVHPDPASNRAISLKSCPAWLFFNSGGTGYYRTDWTQNQLSNFRNEDLSNLTAPERLTFAFDLSALRPVMKKREAVDRILHALAVDHQPEVSRAAKEALAGPKTGNVQ